MNITNHLNLGFCLLSLKAKLSKKHNTVTEYDSKTWSTIFPDQKMISAIQSIHMVIHYILWEHIKLRAYHTWLLDPMTTSLCAIDISRVPLPKSTCGTVFTLLSSVLSIDTHGPWSWKLLDKRDNLSNFNRLLERKIYLLSWTVDWCNVSFISSQSLGIFYHLKFWKIRFRIRCIHHNWNYVSVIINLSLIFCFKDFINRL